jgi:hypothetical protein
MEKAEHWNIIGLQKKYADSYRDFDGFWSADGLQERVDAALENYRGMDYTAELLLAVRDITMNLCYELGDQVDSKMVTDEYIANVMYTVLEMITTRNWLKV